jgi:hypothetical protein
MIFGATFKLITWIESQQNLNENSKIDLSLNLN